MPLRAGNLGRVSEDDSGRLRSVSEQHDANESAIKANGWLEAARYEDEGSASRFARKAREDWARLQADLDAGHLDIVVMWDTSRASREPEDWFAFLRRCRVGGILIYVTTEERTYNVTIARDWKTMADAGVDNAYESEKKSRDVKRGVAANAAAGMPHGVRQYGFERTHDQRTGELTGQRPVPAEAVIVTEVITRIATAEPVSAVTEDLNARGIPAHGGNHGSGKWDRRTVRRMATSPAYIGMRRVDGELVKAQWPAIVDDDTFWAAVHVLSDPARKRAVKPIRPGKAKFLLSYIMHCECGGDISVNTPRWRMVTVNYWCADPRRHCSKIRMDEADEFVTAAVVKRLSSRDFYEHLGAGSDEKIFQARAEAARLRAELDEWAAADINARAYKIREDKLMPLIEAAEKRAEELTVPVALRGLATPGADIQARWGAMTLAARRDVVRTLFPDLVLLAGDGPAHARITYGRPQQLDQPADALGSRMRTHSCR
jgi:site-specific DNA recombinase